ncbi:hypothetical protein HAX54_033542 [Datura stramonium]|uniref:Uncharacterized protein n=1 Tax=Datura stramonium TaxID=4076 RepID=A0ABS8SDF6_DATST|nr:hypothetical protein [Datura stramonium]
MDSRYTRDILLIVKCYVIHKYPRSKLKTTGILKLSPGAVESKTKEATLLLSCYRHHSRQKISKDSMSFHNLLGKTVTDKLSIASLLTD